MGNIVIASMYKSGSSHIAQSLASVFGSQVSFICGVKEGWAADPQQIDLHSADAVFTRMGGMVYMQHILGTDRNIGILKILQGPPPVIVTMRKLYPMLHSLVKYADKKSEMGSLWMLPLIVHHWDSMDYYQKWMWVAQNTIPWYFQFYVSWKKADYSQKILVWYEDHFRDQISSARRILELLGEDNGLYTDDHLKSAFIHYNSNYTEDRSQLEMPEDVRKIAEQNLIGWGHFSEDLRRDLLD